jgi:hypothetical protein
MAVWSRLQMITQKIRSGNYFYFYFYRSVFKICHCFTATYCPQTWGPCTQVQVTQDGGNKLPAKVFYSNFLLLVCRLGRAPWQTRMASDWRGFVWTLKKSGTFRDSTQDGLLTSAGIHMKKCSHTHVFLCIM